MGNINFLLINPQTNYSRERILPPLGLMYIASALENIGISVKILDAFVLNFSHEKVIETIKKESPKFIGIYSNVLNFNECKKLIKSIKKLLPESYIILGGPFSSSFPYYSMKEIPELDFCIIGEGERTIIDIVQKIDKKSLIENIKGIAFRKNNKIHITKKCNLIKDLDSIPFPARHLIPIKKYKFLPHEFRYTPITTMICSRGCPFYCSFCSKSVFGNKYRVRNPKAVISEIINVINDYSIKEILFLDDTFGLNKSWNEKFCGLLIKEKLDITWSCETRIDIMNKKILLKMAKAGCWSILYGLESGDQRLLNLLNKRITIDKIRKVVSLTKDANISVRASFILGLPTETKQETIKTIKFAKLLNPIYAQFHLLAPFEGTQIYDICKKEGKILNKNYFDYDFPYKVNYLPSTYDSREELIKMQKFAYRSFYLNPKKMSEIISKIKSFNNFKSWINIAKLAL
jgi:radical SAM superfamily enzyme YgiQ (UPF0313 family)